MMHKRANRIASESDFRRLAVDADTTGRMGRYNRLQRPIQPAAECKGRRALDWEADRPHR